MLLSILILFFLGYLCIEYKEWWIRSSCLDFKRVVWRIDIVIVVWDKRENF